MSVTDLLHRTSKRSPRERARVAGAFYLLTFVAGMIALVSPSGRLVANGIAIAAYLGVTWLFYGLFKPVSRSLSLLAACFSVAGCFIGLLGTVGLGSVPINPLALFGCYCLLIGYLLIESTFLPRLLGVAMIMGGLGWLTFLSPELAAAMSPYNLVPGMIGEGLLTVWLLVAGLHEQRWMEQARSRAPGPLAAAAGARS